MRRLIKTFILCSFLLLIMTSASQATIMSGQNYERLSGKLNSITKLSDRYKLRINKHILFIMKNDDQHTKEIIKTAKSLIHKKVTITYNKTNNFITAIEPYKKKKLY